MKASPQDLAKLTQLQATQTLGRKKFMSSDFTVINNNEVDEGDQEAGRVPSCVRKGKKRKRRRQQEEAEEDEEGKEQEQQPPDPSVVRLGVRKLCLSLRAQIKGRVQNLKKAHSILLLKEK